MTVKHFTVYASCPNYPHTCADGTERECEGGKRESAALRLAFGIGKRGLRLLPEGHNEGKRHTYQDSATTTRQYWTVDRPLTKKVHALLAIAHIATGTPFIIDATNA